MHVIPVHTGKIINTDNLCNVLLAHCSLQDGDIVTISSKVIAYTEGAAIHLQELTVSDEAKALSESLSFSKKNPAFEQAVLNETLRMNGRILYTCPFAIFCELRPTGLETGVILAVNAGLDVSNIEKNFAIGWPMDPVVSARRLQTELQQRSGKSIGIIISDSCCFPRRLGVVATALTVAGFTPLKNEIGASDLWGRKLVVTQEAQADQLAIAANFVMGNADQAVPAAILRDTNIPLDSFCGWVPGIEPEQDMYQGIV